MDADRYRRQLESLAKNLYWCWGLDPDSLFRPLDPEGWERCHHDPHAQIAGLDDAQLVAAVERAGLARVIDEAERHLGLYLEDRETWGRRHASLLSRSPIAYFSAEFGLHESVAIYSGGLGVLAGDHLKSASDMGLPLVAVGLWYREGYFEQTLDASGWQQEAYPIVDPRDRGFFPARDVTGQPIRLTVETRDNAIHVQVWERAVGRVRLFLLDTNLPENSDEDRELTRRLYGGDQRNRIRQELLLGVGGVRALRALGIRPGVFHINEGHSAFAPFEIAAGYMEQEGISLDEALHEVGSRTLFTTHTPVPAGHDRFPPDLVLEHLEPFIRRLGLETPERLLAFGRIRPDDANETFCMTVLALKTAHQVNGVSFLHGRVSRRMWNDLWSDRRPWEVPIGHVTNGVHVPSWMSTRMANLLDEYLPGDWRDRQWDPEAWRGAFEIDDATLWEVRNGLKRDLIQLVRRRASADAERRGESADVVAAMRDALDEDALLIGFARRFATYKRAALLLDDLDRLSALVNDPEQPIRVVFAGKAHPRDEGGKRMLQQVFEATRDPRLRGKVLLLDGYDIALGRALTSGVDVWLNNPRRPLEASGTSGQKVVLNGGLNCSILDGWWSEAYDGANGFAIGEGEIHKDVKLQDARDAEALLHTLGNEVAALYYERRDGLPVAWLARVKRGLATLAWRFNSDRMVRDYALQGYLPSGGIQLSDAR